MNDEVKKLVEEIERHNRHYWENGEPRISDAEYDELTRRLQRLAPDHPLLNRVHAPEVASEGKVRHQTPMLSLSKAYSFEELMEWARKVARTEDERFLVEPKYDGISANFVDGVLATRGDGINGENVSDKIPLIELEADGYKGKLDRPARGEIVIRDDDFKTIYGSIMKKNGEPYKNSRNAVSGIMGLKEIDDMIEQGAKLTLVDYDMISHQLTLSEFNERWPKLVESIEELPYPMDGIVVKLADRDYADSLGSTAHHPRGQIAFKFSGVRKPTRLLDVVWSFGKNCLTPVAELEPVDIGGITIKHATLHNVQNVIDKDIHIGDTVTVERAGDVIPHIVDASPGKERKSCLIDQCPCCGFDLERSGPELRCPNPDCFETKLRRLLAAVRNIGIERLGEPNIRKMMTHLDVQSLRDVFELKLTDILKLDGFKEKSASNLYNEIQNARNVDDFEVLTALNISGIGKNVAKDLMGQFTLDELRAKSQEELAEVRGIGPERAAALESELKSQGDVLDELLSCVNLNVTSKTEASAVKPTICFTGKMPEKRSHYEGLARDRGYEPKDSVTEDLSLLVAADPNSSSSKLAKARKHDVPIQSLEGWLAEKPASETSPRDSQRPSSQTDETPPDDQLTFNF